MLAVVRKQRVSLVMSLFVGAGLPAIDFVSHGADREQARSHRVGLTVDPVSVAQAGDAAKLSYVICNQHCVDGHRVPCNQNIVRPYRIADLFELSLYEGCLLGRCSTPVGYAVKPGHKVSNNAGHFGLARLLFAPNRSSA